MRSPTRLGNPTLGIADNGTPPSGAHSSITPSRSCGPMVQFAPMAWTSFSLTFSHTSWGRMPPSVRPSSENVISATIGNLENERMASMASNSSSKSPNVSSKKRSPPRSSIAAACSRKMSRTTAGGKGVTCRAEPRGPIEPAMRTSRAAASRASRATFTPA